MSIEVIFYKYYSPWVAIPIICVSGFLLVMAIVHLAGLFANKELSNVPVAPEQLIEFHRAGPVLLFIEGPRFTRRFAGLKFVLEAQGSGERVAMTPILYRLWSSGIRSSRVAVETHAIPRSGKYIFRIVGLDPGADYADHRIIFSESILIELFVNIIAVIVFAGLTIGSLVMFIIRMIGPGAEQ